MSREQIIAELQRRGVPQVGQPVTAQPRRDEILAELQRRQPQANKVCPFHPRPRCQSAQTIRPLVLIVIN